MNISIVIPNYNGERILQKNLPKVLSMGRDYKEIITEIIVVDDGSTDKSILILERLTLHVRNLKLKIIKQEKNLGFASTVNRGVREATSEIILLLNTDAYPEKGFLQPAISHFVDEKVFAIGGMDKSIEGNKVVLRGRGVGRWQHGFLMHSRGEVDKENTLWVSLGSSFIRKSAWEILGGLQELYNPFYWEDIDISYRALKSGYKLIFESKSVFIHEHEKGAIRSHFSTNQVRQIAYRNQFFFVWLNGVELSIIYSHVFWLPYHFITALIRGDFAFYVGFWMALSRFIPEIISIRTQNQKMFIKKDREVISEFKE